jgi:hypothetical protein
MCRIDIKDSSLCYSEFDALEHLHGFYAINEFDSGLVPWGR